MNNFIKVGLIEKTSKLIYILNDKYGVVINIGDLNTHASLSFEIIASIEESIQLSKNGMLKQLKLLVRYIMQYGRQSIPVYDTLYHRVQIPFLRGLKILKNLRDITPFWQKLYTFNKIYKLNTIFGYIFFYTRCVIYLGQWEGFIR